MQVRTFSDDPTPTTSPDQAVESALSALRGLWREGLTTSRLEVSKARRDIVQLSAWAPDGETHDRIRKIVDRLEAYRFLDDVQRAEELKALAAAIKELGTGLRLPAVGTAPVGMLNSAIAPGRAPARTAAPPPPPPLPVEPKPRAPAVVPGAQA